jgi:hypothetical protein
MWIRLRAVQKRDFADLRAMAESFHGEDGNPIDAKAEAAALLFSLGHAGAHAWLAFSATETVGYAVITVRPDEFGTHEAEIEELYAIHKNRQVFAGMILEQVCREAFGLGARRLFVALAPSDVARRYYFARHGFRPDRAGNVMRLLP